MVGVIGVEIKRGEKIRSEREEVEVFWYMREVGVKLGLYIGEKIELYYDGEEKKENGIGKGIGVMSVKIKDRDNKGEVLCDVLG